MTEYDPLPFVSWAIEATKLARSEALKVTESVMGSIF
jgi:hypothetical protein